MKGPLNAAVCLPTRLSRLQRRHVYEDTQEEQDDSYEPPPSHTPLATANAAAAAFSGEEYLGGCSFAASWAAGALLRAVGRVCVCVCTASEPAFIQIRSSFTDNRHNFPQRPAKKPVCPTRNASGPPRPRAANLESDEVKSHTHTHTQARARGRVLARDRLATLPSGLYRPGRRSHRGQLRGTSRDPLGERPVGVIG